MMNKIDISNELSQNFIDFSYEANSCRAFADARDGLKPGQRACLWEMYINKYTSNKPHVKSAKIDGGVAAKWWPHGTTAIYETFSRMSQSWINNITEVDWHGGNGSIVISGEPSADRYTEARLSKAAEEGLLYGINKENVKMIPNFLEDDKWPEVLPAIFPRLIVNGCQGIGVTIANVWLPHSLIEVTNSIKEYILSGKINYSNIFPSFPTGGIIINKNDIHSIYETGKGKVVLRAKTEIKNNSILITELPYQVYIEPLIDKIKKLINDGVLDGIENIDNKTTKNKLLIEIECDKDPNLVLRKLFKTTDLQKTFNANQWALVGKTPKLLNFKEYLDIYINHNILCIKKENEFELKKAKDRFEIVEGLIKALEDIDNIISLIKKSKSSLVAIDELIDKYNFTNNQAKAIIDMKLGKLANLEKIELNEEKLSLTSKIDKVEEIIRNEKKRKEIFLERLENFTKKYGKTRRTELTQIDVSKDEKSQIVPEDVVVIMTKAGDIKRIPKSSFKIQKRNGKGVKNEDDTLLLSLSTNTLDNLLLFTTVGKMYKLLVDNIPVGTNTSKGVNINTLIKNESNERVVAATSLKDSSKAQYVVFFTKRGLLKKTKMEEYSNIKKNIGINAIKLKDDDEIVNVVFMNDEDAMIITKNGMAIRFETKYITPIGRVTCGVKCINLAEDDEVLVGTPICEGDNAVAVFLESGFGKRCKLEEFPVQGRGGRGLTIYKDRKVTGALLVKDTDDILIIGRPNSICINAADISYVGRAAAGNLVIKDSKITSAIKL